MEEAVIDCDLHNAVPDRDTLLQYLPGHWQQYYRESGFVEPDADDYPVRAATSCVPELLNGSSGIADLSALRRGALDPWATEVGILTCGYRVQSVQNEDLAEAVAVAANLWQVDRWLERDDRLRASLVVPSQNPQMAAKVIDQFGDHPGFVQVLLPVRSDAPYGTRRYDPIYAAAERHGLSIGIHFGGAPGFAPTPAGWPTTYIEEFSVMTVVFQAQLMSLVFGGAFARFPELRVVLIESGFTWLPAWMWRADQYWRSLRRETPWVTRPPSDYVREHVRLTLQPIHGPADDAHLLEVIEQLESEDLLMFSTDYPHWHFDTPEDALPRGLPTGLRTKILSENARSFYGFA